MQPRNKHRARVHAGWLHGACSEPPVTGLSIASFMSFVSFGKNDGTASHGSWNHLDVLKSRCLLEMTS